MAKELKKTVSPSLEPGSAISQANANYFHTVLVMLFTFFHLTERALGRFCCLNQSSLLKSVQH